MLTQDKKDPPPGSRGCIYLPTFGRAAFSFLFYVTSGTPHHSKLGHLPPDSATLNSSGEAQRTLGQAGGLARQTSMYSEQQQSFTVYPFGLSLLFSGGERWRTSQRSGHAALLSFRERDRAGNRTRRGQCTVKWGNLKNDEPKARMEPRADEREPRAEGSTAFTPPEAAGARAKEEPQVPREIAPHPRRAVAFESYR